MPVTGIRPQPAAIVESPQLIKESRIDLVETGQCGNLAVVLPGAVALAHVLSDPVWRRHAAMADRWAMRPFYRRVAAATGAEANTLQGVGCTASSAPGCTATAPFHLA